MTFDQVCDAVRLYVQDRPADGRESDWRGRLDEVLADIRAELSDTRPAA
jgi:hypothetical protein